MNDLTPVQAVDECIYRLQQYRSEIAQTANIIKVRQGEDLQKAHDAAAPGDTLLVQPGRYLGVVLNKPINILPDATIPSGRIDKYQDGLIVLASRDGITEPLLIPGNLVNVMGVKLEPVATDRTICTVSGDKDTLDRIIILGNPNTGQRRGIAANCSNFTLQKSYIDDIFHVSDAQAVMVWNGSGPFLIDDNYMSASGETFMSGGADSIKQPSQLTFTNNYLTKNTNWHTPLATAKNIFELKDMVGADIRNNTFENCWADGQTGYLILFTPRNQDGTEPYAEVSHIHIMGNIIRNGGAGVQLLGADTNNPSKQTTDITIENNLFDNIGAYPGAHRLFQFTGVPGCKNVRIAHNGATNCKDMNSFLYLDTHLENLVFTYNDVPEGEYGLMATNGSPGIKSWNLMVTGGEFSNNTIHAGGFRTIDYGGNGNVVVP